MFNKLINTRKKISFLVLFSLFFASQSCQDELETYQGNGIDEHHDIVIVGGGISGLTCGYYLGNKDFIILEKNDRVGGRAVSGVHNNFTYAKGAEYLGEPESHLYKMIKGLGLTVREIPSPMDAYFDGKEFYYGCDGLARYLVNGSSVDTYKHFVRLLLSEYDKYDDVPDVEYNAHTMRLDNMSASDWLRSNSIPDIYINKYNVASRGLFGASLDEISALSLIPEAAFDYDEEDLKYINGHFDVTNEYKYACEEESESYTFTRGLTELTDCLGQRMSGKIRLNSQVTEVTREDNHYVIRYKHNNGSQTIMTANKVVMSIPAPLALDIAPTLISDEKKGIIEQIEFSSYATVALFSNTPVFNKAFDLAVPDSYFFTDIYDATWVERHYDKKPVDTYIMSVYIAPHTYKDHSLDKMSDKEILNRVYADLDKVFPGASKKITGYDIERFPYAYPVMTQGAYKRLSRLSDINKGTFILSGDYTIYPTFESAVEAGWHAARRL